MYIQIRCVQKTGHGGDTGEGSCEKQTFRGRRVVNNAKEHVERTLQADAPYPGDMYVQCECFDSAFDGKLKKVLVVSQRRQTAESPKYNTKSR
jgi:hypothetical protein